MSIKIKPTGDRMLVRKLDDAKVTPGGIILPVHVENPIAKGIVLGVGPGRNLEGGGYSTMPADKGQMVLYAQRSGVKIDENQADLRILGSHEVLAVIEGEESDAGT